MNDPVINWNVFTKEEHDHINALMRLGAWTSIAAAIKITDPEKEVALQGILDKYRPVGKPLESKVLEEMRGVDIDTPAKEAEWQAKLDAEQAEFEKGKKEKPTPPVPTTEAPVETETPEAPVDAVATETTPEVLGGTTKRRGRPPKNPVA